MACWRLEALRLVFVEAIMDGKIECWGSRGSQVSQDGLERKANVN